MKNFILSLPCGSNVADFETMQVKHPKGREVTCFVRGHDLFELQHFEFKRGAASCFVTVDGVSKGYLITKNFYFDFVVETFFSYFSFLRVELDMFRCLFTTSSGV